MTYQGYDLLKIKALLIQTALEVGDMMLAFNSHPSSKIQYEEKKNSVDLVTELDQNIEHYIKGKLLAAFPDFKFIGEETFKFGVDHIPDDPCFVIDPLDGTLNYIHSFPMSCTSLAFIYQKEPLVGVVYNPHLNQLFHAAKGFGAELNGNPLNKLSNKEITLRSTLLALEGGSDRSGETFDTKFDTYKQLMSASGPMIHGFRSTGSAALNLCYVAQGWVDAYWMACLPWDCAAAWCIALENGCLIVDGNKDNWDPVGIENRYFLCVRDGKGQLEFVQEFWDQITGKLHNILPKN